MLCPVTLTWSAMAEVLSFLARALSVVVVTFKSDGSDTWQTQAVSFSPRKSLRREDFSGRHSLRTGALST